MSFCMLHDLESSNIHHRAGWTFGGVAEAHPGVATCILIAYSIKPWFRRDYFLDFMINYISQSFWATCFLLLGFIYNYKPIGT